MKGLKAYVEQIGLFIRQAPAAEDPHGIGAVRRANREQLPGHAIERVVPTDRPQGVALVCAHQRSGQPAGNAQQLIGGQPLRHKPPLFVGKFRAVTRNSAPLSTRVMQH
jgi:hypothetical protein